jgi:hypothetical protein
MGCRWRGRFGLLAGGVIHGANDLGGLGARAWRPGRGDRGAGGGK